MNVNNNDNLGKTIIAGKVIIIISQSYYNYYKVSDDVTDKLIMLQLTGKQGC